MGEKELLFLDKVVLWIKEPSTFRGFVLAVNVLFKLGIPEYTVESMMVVIAGIVGLYEMWRKELR